MEHVDGMGMRTHHTTAAHKRVLLIDSNTACNSSCVHLSAKVHQQTGQAVHYNMVEQILAEIVAQPPAPLAHTLASRLVQYV